MEENIVIIGAGEIGRAIEKILEEKGFSLTLWDKDASKVSNQGLLSELIPAADFVFLCIPSWVTRDAVVSIVPYLKKETVVVSLAKGIEEKSSKTIDELLEETLPQKQPFAILSGPMLAEEIMKGMRGIAVVGFLNANVCSKVTELFAGTKLSLECSSDIHGVALSGVLKNAYTIVLGVADGLGLSGNEKGWLVSKALREMVEIINLLGGKNETIFGTAGLGDFIATGYSSYSRNRLIGEELVKTGKCCTDGEGAISLSALIKKLNGKSHEFLLLTALENILVKKQNAKEVFQKLFEEIG